MTAVRLVGAGLGSRPRRVGYRKPEPVPAAFFESPQARAAMGARDVAEVFAILGRMGVSQRRIAALTGQSQSEISEIRAGRRVQSVELMERICDGLGTPRGWWGLAHTDDAVTPPTPCVDESAPPAVAAAPAIASGFATPVPPQSRARVAAPDIEVARHLVGLVSALRASVTPPTTAMRPSRECGVRRRQTRTRRR